MEPVSVGGGGGGGEGGEGRGGEEGGEEGGQGGEDTVYMYVCVRDRELSLYACLRGCVCNCKGVRVADG